MTPDATAIARTANTTGACPGSSSRSRRTHRSSHDERPTWPAIPSRYAAPPVHTSCAGSSSSATASTSTGGTTSWATGTVRPRSERAAAHTPPAPSTPAVLPIGLATTYNGVPLHR